MKKLIVGMAVLAASTVYAEEDTSRVVNFPTYCVEVKTLENVLDKFEELPYVRGVSSREINGQKLESPLVIFINQKEKTFTIAERVSETHFCLVAVGARFEPVPEDVRKGIETRRRNSTP